MHEGSTNGPIDEQPSYRDAHPNSGIKLSSSFLTSIQFLIKGMADSVSQMGTIQNWHTHQILQSSSKWCQESVMTVSISTNLEF